MKPNLYYLNKKRAKRLYVNIIPSLKKINDTTIVIELLRNGRFVGYAGAFGPVQKMENAQNVHKIYLGKLGSIRDDEFFNQCIAEEREMDVQIKKNRWFKK